MDLENMKLILRKERRYILPSIISSGESEFVRRNSFARLRDAAGSLIVTVFFGLTPVISRPNALAVFSLDTIDS